jgi:hypothetical protein
MISQSTAKTQNKKILSLPCEAYSAQTNAVIGHSTIKATNKI